MLGAYKMPVKSPSKPNKRQAPTRPGGRGFRAPLAVQNYIADLDERGGIPKKQILADVNAAYPADAVSPRTLARILKEQRSQRRGEADAWSPRKPTKGVDVELALPAVTALLNWSAGRRHQ